MEVENWDAYGVKMAMLGLKIWTRSPIILFCTLLLLTGCNPVDVNPLPEAPWPTESWSTSSPEAQGMDSDTLAAMLELVTEENYRIDSISVIRNGYLVLDVPIHPYKEGKKHEVRSVTKSVISLLVGIAIDGGYIDSVDTPVLDFFPNYTVDNLDSDKEAMTLEDVLTMSGGWRCRDSYRYSWDGLYRMWESEDWAQFMLDLPMEAEPGEKFEYCNGGSYMLSAILTETTGVTALEFAEEHLFRPLGITEVAWPMNPQGITIGYSDLRMLPKDMAKIGYLVLRDGQWDGAQIVSTTWIEESTRDQISSTLTDGYGYQWWVDRGGFPMALGYAGQYIVVHPELDLVVVFISELPETDFYIPQMLLEDYIFTAVVSDEWLPEDPAGERELQRWIEALANP